MTLSLKHGREPAFNNVACAVSVDGKAARHGKQLKKSGEQQRKEKKEGCGGARERPV